jgi:hypothetical protein
LAMVAAMEQHATAVSCFGVCWAGLCICLRLALA